MPANIGLTALNLVLLGALPLSFISAAQWASIEGWGLLNLIALSLPLAVEALYNMLGIPFIDTIHFSIEEIASTILNETSVERRPGSRGISSFVSDARRQPMASSRTATLELEPSN